MSIKATGSPITNQTLKECHLEARKRRGLSSKIPVSGCISSSATRKIFQSQSPNKNTSQRPRIMTLQDLAKRPSTKASSLPPSFTYSSQSALTGLPTNVWTLDRLKKRDQERRAHTLEQMKKEAGPETYYGKRIARLAHKKHWTFQDTANGSLYRGSLIKLLETRSLVEEIDCLSSDFSDKELLAIATAKAEGRLPNLKVVRIIPIPNLVDRGITQKGMDLFQQNALGITLKIQTIQEMGEDLSIKVRAVYAGLVKDSISKTPPGHPISLEIRQLLQEYENFQFTMGWIHDNLPSCDHRNVAEEMQECLTKLKNLDNIRHLSQDSILTLKRLRIQSITGSMNGIYTEFQEYLNRESPFA